MENPTFAGLHVVAFESRREREIAELVRRRGGEPVSAPAMRELPRPESPEALRFGRRLATGEIDVVVLLTGVGTRLLAEAVAPELSRERFAEALARIVTICRGPKPVAVLRELGVRPSFVVPEPNTWRDLLATVDAGVPVAGKTVAVQEYGMENRDLLDGLTDRGARVDRVPVYRWALPEDREPLETAIERIVRDEIEVALFTSATQVHHVFQIAGARADALRAAFSRLVVASIGPVCTAALREHGVDVDLEPRHPKMGHLVRTAAEESRTILSRKRNRRGGARHSGREGGKLPE